MKVGLVSDSHDNLPKLRAAMERFRAEGVEHIIHAGDFIAPFTAAPFVELGVPVTGVFGNNDGERRGLAARFAPVGELHFPTAKLELGGKRFVVMHEPDLAEAAARSGLYEVVVCGHTHVLEVRTAGALIINPGECGGWVTGRSTVVVLETETLEARVVDLD